MNDTESIFELIDITPKGAKQIYWITAFLLIAVNSMVGQVEISTSTATGNYSAFPVDHIYFNNDNPQNVAGATRIEVDSTSTLSVINESKMHFVDASGNRVGVGASGIRLKSEYLEIMSADVVDPSLGQMYVPPPWDFEKVVGVGYSGMSLAGNKDISRAESGAKIDMLAIAHGRIEFNSNTVLTGSANYTVDRVATGVEIVFTNLDIDDLVITATPYSYVNDNQSMVLVTQAGIEKIGSNKIRIHMYDVFGSHHPEAEFSFVVFKP